MAPRKIPRLNLRFRISQQGKEQLDLQEPDREGVILYERGDCYVLVFDNTQRKRSFHKGFVEIIQFGPNLR